MRIQYDQAKDKIDEAAKLHKEMAETKRLVQSLESEVLVLKGTIAAERQMTGLFELVFRSSNWAEKALKDGEGAQKEKLKLLETIKVMQFGEGRGYEMDC